MPILIEFQWDLITCPPLESDIFENHKLFYKGITNWVFNENFCFQIFQHH